MTPVNPRPARASGSGEPRATAGPNPAGLRHRGETFLNFANGSVRWVHVQRFDLAADVGDREALALMISDGRYGRDYAGGSPGQDPERHGPYWRERIAPGAFDLADVDAEEAPTPEAVPRGKVEVDSSG